MNEQNLPPLTDRQAAIFDWIKRYIDANQYSPTIQEIADEFGIKSRNGVVCNLKALAKKGRIRRDANRSRAIVVEAWTPPPKICVHCGRET